jgi:activating signal cointegrator 1
MKGVALSIRQPWTSLILLGLKSVEIRSWPTSYRGPLFLHAAKTLDEHALKRFRLSDIPTGCLIGVVDLMNVEPFTPATWRKLAPEHLDTGPFTPGLYAWHLANPRPLRRPVPWRGDRSLFEIEVPEDLLVTS